MKKIIAFVLTAGMLLTMSVTAFAAEINQDSDPKTTDTVITAEIAPSYTVTIPADIEVAFNETETAFGTIEIDAAQIDPDKCIRVTLAADGNLENAIDNTKVIPYEITADSAAFTSAVYLATGDATDLTINILQDDWDQAYAGSYSDTVTFTVSYEDKVIE